MFRLSFKASTRIKLQMSKIQIDKIGLLVGLEIHQQLATGDKLFCRCKPIESDEYPIKFSRKLRITSSELGEFDPSAIFEKSKEKTILYSANPESSCLVEQDGALGTAVLATATVKVMLLGFVPPAAMTVELVHVTTWPAAEQAQPVPV